MNESKYPLIQDARNAVVDSLQEDFLGEVELEADTEVFDFEQEYYRVMTLYSDEPPIEEAPFIVLKILLSYRGLFAEDLVVYCRMIFRAVTVNFNKIDRQNTARELERMTKSLSALQAVGLFDHRDPFPLSF